MIIQSISDIITNSSSEAFMTVSYNGIDIFKEIINSILKLSHSNKTCDDYFIILEGDDNDINVIPKNSESVETVHILNKVNNIFYIEEE